MPVHQKLPTYVLDIETTSLDPSEATVLEIPLETETGEKTRETVEIPPRVVAIGIYDTETAQMEIFAHDDERVLLEAFWRFLPEKFYFIGYNIGKFDEHYLKIRSILHNIKIRRFYFWDLMLALTPYPHKYKKKEAWLEFFGLERGEFADAWRGSDVPLLFFHNRKKEIVEHLKKDLVKQFELYKMLRDCGYYYDVR